MEAPEAGLPSTRRRVGLHSVTAFPNTHPTLWYCRCEDLEHIYNQLMTIKVRGMAGLLDKLQSSYLPAFRAMFRDVEAGEERQVFPQISLTQRFPRPCISFSLFMMPGSSHPYYLHIWHRTVWWQGCHFRKQLCLWVSCL